MLIRQSNTLLFIKRNFTKRVWLKKILFIFSSSRNFLDSEPDSDEGVVTKPSSSKRHPEPAVTGLRRSSSTGKDSDNSIKSGNWWSNELTDLTRQCLHFCIQKHYSSQSMFCYFYMHLYLRVWIDRISRCYGYQWCKTKDSRDNRLCPHQNC